MKISSLENSKFFMKQVTVFSAGLGSGGAEHQCSFLMNSLIEAGYDVTYVSFYDISDHYAVDDNIKRVRIAPGKSSITKLFAIIYYFFKASPDVLIAFSQRMTVLSIIPVRLRKVHIKHIACERNLSSNGADRWEKIIRFFKLYKYTDYVVPNSHSQGDYLSMSMPYIKDKIRVITNYTDIEKYKPTDLPHNSPLKIGVFCRFEKQKNVLNFIKAINILSQKDSLSFCIDWYGNHSFETEEQKKYYDECLLKIKKYNLTNVICVHNPIKDVAAAIPNYDLMCLPSLFEGFSNSLAEYISCGRPVICSNASDNSLMVQDGVNGFLFDPNNVNDMANAFLKYFSLSESKREEMGINSRKIAEALFNKQSFLNSYIELIEN